MPTHPVRTSTTDLPSLLERVAEVTNPAMMYLATLGSPQSRRVMMSRMNRFARMLQYGNWREIPWRQLDRSWLLLAKEVLSTEKCSPDTINAMLSMLKGVALQAWELNLIADHSFMRIKNTKAVRGLRLPKRRWLVKEEIGALLDACQADTRVQGLRDAALIALLYGCGLRRSELIGIDIGDVDRVERTLAIRGKGNKQRAVYPPDRAWDLLLRWLDHGHRATPPAPLFCRIRKGGCVTGERLTDQAVYAIVRNLAASCGIQEFSPHDLRGSFISYLLDSGADIKTVADIVGHADVSTTAGYDRRGERRKQIVNRSIDM